MNNQSGDYLLKHSPASPTDEPRTLSSSDVAAPPKRFFSKELMQMMADVMTFFLMFFSFICPPLTVGFIFIAPTIAGVNASNGCHAVNGTCHTFFDVPLHLAAIRPAVFRGDVASLCPITMSCYISTSADFINTSAALFWGNASANSSSSPRFFVSPGLGSLSNLRAQLLYLPLCGSLFGSIPQSFKIVVIQCLLGTVSSLFLNWLASLDAVSKGSVWVQAWCLHKWRKFRKKSEATRILENQRDEPGYDATLETNMSEMSHAAFCGN